MLLIHLIARLRVSLIRLPRRDVSVPDTDSPEMVNEPVEIANPQNQDDDCQPIQD